MWIKVIFQPLFKLCFKYCSFRWFLITCFIYTMFYLGESFEYRGMLVLWCTGYRKVCCVCMYVVFWQTTGYKFNRNGSKFIHIYFWNILRYFYGFFEISKFVPHFRRKICFLSPKWWRYKIYFLFGFVQNTSI